MPIRKAAGFAAQPSSDLQAAFVACLGGGRDLLAVESPRTSPEITIPLLPTSVVDDGTAELARSHRMQDRSGNPATVKRRK